jgi:hypothetical protein
MEEIIDYRQNEVIDGLDIHKECKNQCRSSIIAQFIERYPESLAKSNPRGFMPLHMLLCNESSCIDLALMMIEKYPAAVQHPNCLSHLPIHIECMNQCRASIVSKCIELYPESLTMADQGGELPLHHLLKNDLSSIDTGTALIVIEKYPAALHHRNADGYLPLHIECEYECRSSILSKCIELYPEGLEVADEEGYLPLSYLLPNPLSSIGDALMIIDKYPGLLSHQDSDGELPLHIECMNQCRSSIISKCIELYPEALAQVDEKGYLPLHSLLSNRSSIIYDTIMLIDQNPAALLHRNRHGRLPLTAECMNQCRPSLISKCIKLYPQALEHKAFFAILSKVDKSNFQAYASVLSVLFAAFPMSLYDTHNNTFFEDDIRADPDCRRRILNLLPHHVFTLTHDADYRNLNWQFRSALVMFLSQMKIQKKNTCRYQQSRQG